MAEVTKHTNAVVVRLPADEIVDWNSFHDVFRRVFGFPDLYGRNMNAWIDCLTDLDDASDGMSAIKVAAGGVVVLEIPYAEEFKQRCPEQFDALIDCAAFVNRRRAEESRPAVLTLALM